MIHLFCPQCGTYLGRSDKCEACGYRRSPVERPVPPGQVFWRVKVPGEVGRHLTLTMLGERPVLLVPWSERPEYRPAFGGVVALDARTGEEVWSWRSKGPVRAGVTVTAGLVLVPVQESLGRGYIVALSVDEPQEQWHLPLPHSVAHPPVVRERRLYLAADDGCLYTYDLHTKKSVFQSLPRISPEPVPIRVPPLLITRGREELIVVGTYGRHFDRIPGDVVAFNAAGREQWRQSAYGNVRGMTWTQDGRMYITAWRNRPSAGFLFALSVGGHPLWDAPFQQQAEAGDRRKHYFSAPPLVVGDVVYVTSLNRHLYAVDARTGEKQWEIELPRSIATQPVHAHGLLLLAVNDACVHGVDLARRKSLGETPIAPQESDSSLESESSLDRARTRRKRVNALTHPVLWQGILFAATTDGTVVAMPWHLGQYAWMAEQFLAEGRYREAGDAFALAAEFATTRQERETYIQRAIEMWKEVEALERLGAFYVGLGQEEAAAAAFLQAGHFHRHRDWRRALWAVRQALKHYRRLRNREGLVKSLQLLSQIAALPFVRVEGFNVPRYRLWERGPLELRVSNEGKRAARNVRLRLGGSLEQSVELTFDRDLEAANNWIVPLEIVPTQEKSYLNVEVIYESDQPHVGQMSLVWLIPLEAERPPTPPPEIKIGDVGWLSLEIAATTREGVRIRTRDVGVIRGTDVGDIQAGGDIGTISARGDIGFVGVQGDVGIIRERPRPKVRVCSQGHENPTDARFCAKCGEALQE